MKIRHISIKNFRGIRDMDWVVPDKNIVCLVGRGDSTKSTILESIRCVFHPQWSLSFDDADFYACKPSNQICIEIIVTNILDEFRDLARYGHLMCGWNIVAQERRPDPGEDLEDALRLRFEVNSDLEPKWTVVKNDADEGAPFKANDRAKAAVTLIGAFYDRHLTWGRGSILSQLTEAENITSSLTDAARAAKSALNNRRAEDLVDFDAVAKKAEMTAKSLGVVVSESYKAHLDIDALNVQMGGLALHDGDMPLRQLGLGSKRMLMVGLQKEALQEQHITLCDEVEIALEPHRIARLLHHLKQDITGQYFITTHSPVVLRELAVDDLHIVHSKGGKTEIVSAKKPAIADRIQGNIRSGAESFLAPKIIVCEGATEVGFIRGLDRYWISKEKLSLAYQGVAAFDAVGGSKVKQIAENLHELHYDVCVLVDSDEANQFSAQDAENLNAKGITVVMWDGKMSIEERVIADLPWDGVMASCNTARSIHEDSTVLNQIESQYGPGFSRDMAVWTDDASLRTAIGKAAKKKENSSNSGWFKRQSWAQTWVDAISQYFDSQSIQNSDLVTKVTALRTWIDRA